MSPQGLILLLSPPRQHQIMASKNPNDTQRMLVFSHLLNDLQSVLGSDAQHHLAQELQQTPAALRLLVDDAVQPIWGIALSDLDEHTQVQLELFRTRPLLNMLVNDEACIALAEWREYLHCCYVALEETSEQQQVMMDRHFLRDTFKSSSCDDVQRFRRLISEELAPEGLEIDIHITDEGQLQARILRDGLIVQGAVWKRWASDINRIYLTTNYHEEPATRPT